MTYWLQTIHRGRCSNCGRVATVRLMNERNAVLAHLCRSCGNGEVRRNRAVVKWKQTAKPEPSTCGSA